MDDRKNQTAVRSFAQAFASALSASVTQITGSAWPLEVSDQQNPPTSDTRPLPFKVNVEGSLCGDCFVEFYEPQLSELMAKLDVRENNGDAASDGAKALTRVLSMAAAQLKSSLSAQYGELAFKVDFVSGLACGGMFVVPLRSQTDRASSPSVFLYFDGGLLEALMSASAGQEQGEPAKRQFHPTNLRLVMDVELNVSLRFGQREMPLREVLELTSGSVIELDRMVDEPVEMLLDGKVVARGEAVIVDGNYGLRVTEIPQAMEAHLLRR